MRRRLIAEKAEREKEWKAGDLDVVAEVDEDGSSPRFWRPPPASRCSS